VESESVYPCVLYRCSCLGLLNCVFSVFFMFFSVIKINKMIGYVDYFQKELSCVKWSIKLCSLTHSVLQYITYLFLTVACIAVFDFFILSYSWQYCCL